MLCPKVLDNTCFTDSDSGLASMPVEVTDVVEIPVDFDENNYPVDFQTYKCDHFLFAHDDELETRGTIPLTDDDMSSVFEDDMSATHLLGTHMKMT